MSHTSRTYLFLSAALFASGLAASACSERFIEDGPIIYERREEICLIWCDMQRDPDCGAEQPFETLDSCMEFCQSPESPNWGLRENGEDDCLEERRDRDVCMQGETCEKRKILFTMVSEYGSDEECRDEIDILFDCDN